MNPTLKIDTSKFIFALRAYKAATKKDGAEVLNRAARNVAFRASSATKKGSAARIRASLNRDPHLRYALTALALKKRGVGALKSPEFAREVERFVSHRAASANYLRAAWAKAIEDLGGSFRGEKFRGAGGFANKATVRQLVTEIVAITAQPNGSKAASAERVGMVALQKALVFVADDMLQYARDLMGKTARNFSA